MKYFLANSAAALLLLFTGSLGFAVSTTWSGSTNANWPVTGNWNNGIPGSADTAVFNTNPSNGDGTTNPVVIDSGRAVTSLTFDTAAAGPFVIGTTTGNALTLASGGTIQNTSTVVDPETVNAPLALGGNYTFTNAAVSPFATLDFGGTVTGPATTGTTTLTLNGNNTGANTISGVIADGNTGSGDILAVSKAANTGVWILSGSNTYTGGTTVLGSYTASTGAIMLGSNTALGTGTITLGTSATPTTYFQGKNINGAIGATTAVNISNSIVDISGPSATINPVSPNLVGSNNITTSGTLSLGSAIGGSAATATFVNSMANGATFTVGGITYLSSSATTRPQTITAPLGGNTTLNVIDGSSASGDAGIASTLNYGGLTSSILTLDGANNATGGLQFSSGTVVLNYAAATSAGANARLNGIGALTLGSVNLKLNGDSGAPFAEVVGTGGTVLLGGSASTADQINITSNNGSTINLGAIAITGTGAPATLNVATGVAITSTSNNAFGILGAYATIGSGSSYDWAVANGASAIKAYTGYTTLTGTSTGSAGASNSCSGPRVRVIRWLQPLAPWVHSKSIRGPIPALKG